MAVGESLVEIHADGRLIHGTLITPKIQVPGVLFVHGWAGNQEQYLVRARGIAALGCICLTFDLYGHARTQAEQGSVTREQNLHDVLAAYDILYRTPGVDKSAIAVIGSSYGGYLGAILSTLRPIRWLVLRAPALYKDEGWSLPKRGLMKDELKEYRRSVVRPEHNRALKACAAFRGDALLVQSEQDEIIPSQVIANYRTALRQTRSLTVRILEGADHALSSKRFQDDYTNLLLNWAREMVQGAR